MDIAIVMVAIVVALYPNLFFKIKVSVTLWDSQ